MIPLAKIRPTLMELTINTRAVECDAARSPKQIVRGDTPNGDKLDVSNVAWSPAGRLLATGGWDGTTRIWDIHGGGKLLQVLQSSHPKVWNVAWSPDGRRLATAGGS
jgi:WD40 repeat protein